MASRDPLPLMVGPGLVTPDLGVGPLDPRSNTSNALDKPKIKVGGSYSPSHFTKSICKNRVMLLPSSKSNYIPIVETLSS